MAAEARRARAACAEWGESYIQRLEPSGDAHEAVAAVERANVRVERAEESVEDAEAAVRWALRKVQRHGVQFILMYQSAQVTLQTALAVLQSAHVTYQSALRRLIRLEVSSSVIASDKFSPYNFTVGEAADSEVAWADAALSTCESSVARASENVVWAEERVEAASANEEHGVPFLPMYQSAQTTLQSAQMALQSAHESIQAATKRRNDLEVSSQTPPPSLYKP